MSPQNHIDPDDLYRQGVTSFNRGEWSDAIATFNDLQAVSNAYPDVTDLLADARLKLQLMGNGQPLAMAPPRRSLLRPALALLALLFVGSGAYLIVRAMNQPTPPAQAQVVPTAVPPTATS